MTKHFPIYLFFAALAFWAACSKPSPFGSELLDDQLADYAFTDSLTLRCSVVPGDSVLTSDRSSTADYFLCGQLNDPTFGVSTSEIFSLLQLQNLNPGFKPAVDTLKSIELILRYDAAGVYGDTLTPVNLKVYRLDNAGPQLRWDKDYFSNNNSFSASEEIGAVDFTPQPRTALQNPFSADTSATKYAYVRVPLSLSFGQSLFSIDSLQMVNDTLFWKQLRGIKIAATSAATPGAMLAFDLNDAVSRMRLVYRGQGDTSNTNFDYFFAGTNKFTRFTHDYAGTPVAQALGQTDPDRLYVNGMGGVRVKVEIPNAEKLDGVAINKAELVFTVPDVPGDPVALRPASQLVLTELQGDTLSILTSDVLFSLGPSFNSGFAGFGGAPETEVINGTAVKRYRLTVTNRFQAMIADKTGDIRNKTLYVSVYPQRSSAMRSVLYGPRSADFPAKLELKYTRIQ